MKEKLDLRGFFWLYVQQIQYRKIKQKCLYHESKLMKLQQQIYLSRYFIFLNSGRMIPEELEKLIIRHKSEGHLPFFVNW